MLEEIIVISMTTKNEITSSKSDNVTSFECKECGLPFSSKGELVMHNQEEHPEKENDEVN